MKDIKTLAWNGDTREPVKPLCPVHVTKTEKWVIQINGQSGKHKAICKIEPVCNCEEKSDGRI